MANNGNTATEQGKGGGPKTEAGKAIAARNSASHGITSPNPVIPGMETEQDWQAHLDGVRQSLEPQGHLESELADRIALCLWQLKRVTRHTVALTANSIADVEIDYVHGVMITHGIQAVLDAAEGKRHDLPVPTKQELAQTREVRLIPSSRDLDKINALRNAPAPPDRPDPPRPRGPPGQTPRPPGASLQELVEQER